MVWTKTEAKVGGKCCQKQKGRILFEIVLCQEGNRAFMMIQSSTTDKWVRAVMVVKKAPRKAPRRKRKRAQFAARKVQPFSPSSPCHKSLAPSQLPISLTLACGMQDTMLKLVGRKVFYPHPPSPHPPFIVV